MGEAAQNAHGRLPANSR